MSDIIYTSVVQYGGIGIGVGAVYALYRVSNGVIKNVTQALDDLREQMHKDHMVIVARLNGKPRRRIKR